MKRIVKRAFTLVELVVVIAIVAVLSAISVGGYYIYVGKAKEIEAINLAYTISSYVKTLIDPITFDSNFAKPTSSVPARNFTFSYTSEGLNIKLNYLWYKSGSNIVKFTDTNTKFGSIGAISGAISRFLSFYYEKKETIFDGNNNKVGADSPIAERYAIGYGNRTNHLTLGEADENGSYNNVMVENKEKTNSLKNVTDRGIFIGNQENPKQMIPSLSKISNLNDKKEITIHELLYISSWGIGYLINF